MAVGDARVRERECGGDAGGVLEMRERFAHALLGAQVPQRASAQVFLEGARIDRAPACEPLGLDRTQAHFDRLGNGACHFRLQGEHVGLVALVTLRPEVGFRIRRDQVGGVAHAPVRAQHRTGHQGRHAEFVPDCGRTLVRVLVTRCRSARDHFERRDARESSGQLVGETVGVIVLGVISGAILERQYDDGFVSDRDRILVQHELVSHQQYHGQTQNCDDPAVKLLAGRSGDRLIVFNVALALNALRRPFVKPRERQRERKTDDHGNDDQPHCPSRHIEDRKNLRRDLHQQPARRRIERRGAVDVAAL